MEQLLIFVIVVFLVFRFVTRTLKYNKGKAGEQRVIKKLSKLVKQFDEAKVFNNAILETPDGSTQIDHLILSTRGIFVIETKNMSGWIFGGDSQKQWTQTIFSKKTKFQNPIHQNYKHVKAVQSLLAADLGIIFNVVVFVGEAEFKTDLPENVVKLKGLLPYIRSFKQHLLRPEDVQKYASQVQRAISDNSISEKQHIKNVKNSRKNPLCPKCGSPMVLRTALRGDNIGTHFWGCPNFPSCKGIKNVG